MTFNMVGTEKRMKHYKIIVHKGKNQKSDYVSAYGIDNLRKRLMSEIVKDTRTHVEVYALSDKVSTVYGVQYDEAWSGVLFMDGKKNYYWNGIEHKLSRGTGKLMG